MTAPPNPPRLRDGQLFGDLLRDEAVAATPTTAQLAAGATLVDQQVAALTAGGKGAAAATGATAAAKTGIAASLTKIVVPIVAAVTVSGAVGYHYYGRSADDRPAPTSLGGKAQGQSARRSTLRQVAPHVAGPPRGLPAPVEKTVAPAKSVSAAPRRAATPVPRVRAIARDKIESKAAPPGAGDDLERRGKTGPLAPDNDDSATNPPAPAAPVLPSTLPSQLRLYRAAKAAASRGEHARAAQLLRQLLVQYPKSPLAPEAELGRADYLVRAGRADEAEKAIKKIAVDPRHTGRRGEILRVLGDLLRKQGRCKKAKAAYERALAQSLSGREARAARAGIRACGER